MPSAKSCVEEQLLHNNHFTDSLQSSILHFSLNKSATQYVRDILIMVAKENNLTHAGLNEYAFNSTIPFLDHLSFVEMERYKHVFKPKGYLYSVFGGYVQNIENFDEYRVLLMVRDPRDILVSMYYSMSLSHSLPDEQSNKRNDFLLARERSRSISIDEFVVENAKKLSRSLFQYRHLQQENFTNVLVSSYEEMMNDFKTWLTKVTLHLELSVSDDLFNRIIDTHIDLQPLKENLNAHIRNAKAGDYNLKLKTETIEQLNTIFKRDLEIFGYRV